MSHSRLSVVIPAFNEARRLPATLARVRAYLDARGEAYDVLVVDDGSTDGTADVAHAAQGPVEVHQPLYREAMGRLFNRLVQALLLPGLHDTQCGFKLFTAAAAATAFAACRLDGFSFDVEALYVARRRGLRIAELPVVWRNDVATRVGLGGGATAFVDLVRIRVAAARGRYGVPAGGGRPT